MALEGQRVVVTRAAGQAEEFNAQLRAAGATVLEYPVIAIAPPPSWEPVDEAIAQLDSYQWIVLTSANAARLFWERALSVETSAKICAVGPATAAAVECAGRCVDLIPPEHVAEGALTMLEPLVRRGDRVLVPRAAVARDVLPDGLRTVGAQVDVVDVYRNVLPEKTGPFPAEVDWVTFTSASTVKNLLTLAGREVLAGVKLASIGPQTSAALRMHGLPVTVEAQPSTTAGLLDAMLHYLPLGDVLDLHAFAPRDAKTAVEAFLEQAREQGRTALRIIHGRGIGLQREMVQKVLAADAAVASYADAPAEAGGWGATVVTLKK